MEPCERRVLETLRERFQQEIARNGGPQARPHQVERVPGLHRAITVIETQLGLYEHDTGQPETHVPD